LNENSSRLTETQAKIVLTIFQSSPDYIKNDAILKGASISRSTWAVEQNNLIDLGLLEKKSTRNISKNNVFRTVSYRLTERGKAVAFNLSEISKILDSGRSPPIVLGPIEGGSRRAGDVLLENHGVEDPEIFAQLRECIEVALDGYGINFVVDVRQVLESDYKVSWARVPKRVDLLLNILKDFFGADGARTIETMICKNIRSHFELTTASNNDLQTLIAEVIYGSKTASDQEIRNEERFSVRWKQE
jgi:predicted transcriptional regulator